MGPGRDVVFLHGDLTSNNICIDENDMELVIVDWSASPLVGRVPTCGPRGFDVIYFVRHLHMSAPWARTLTWPADALSDRFIRAYVDSYGAPLDGDTWQRQREEISGYARQAVQKKLRRTSLLGRPGKALLQNALYRSWRAYRPPPESLSRPTS
jgi:tRNA A-37 threonylcarbamoyl transferase component Bud32